MLKKVWNKLVDLIVTVLSTFMWISALKVGWDNQIMVGKILIILFVLISLTFIIRTINPLLSGIKEKRTLKRARKYMLNQITYLI